MNRPLHRLVRRLGPTLVLLFVAGSVSAADWPQWRGPDRTGISAETGLADQWPADGPPVVWEIEGLGEGYGAVAVVGDHIYLQGTEGDLSAVYALRSSDGSLAWRTALGPKLIQDKGNGPRSTPTVSGGVVYVVDGRGEVAALAAENGRRIWQFNMLERYDSSNIRWGISESPLLDDGKLYVMPGGRGGAVVALDPATGDTLWRSEGLQDGQGYSSLIAADLMAEDGDPVRVIVGFTAAAGVGVRASDGELMWRYERPANRTANAATPVFADNQAFYSSSYGVGGGAVRLRLENGEVASEEAYFQSKLQNHHGGVVLLDGYLYSFFGPTLTCADFETGEIAWRARSVGKGSLTAADGLLFLLGENHEVGLAVATPEEYRERGRFEIESHGQPSWAYPVVSNGRLYIRDQQALTVYDVSAAAMSDRAASGS